MTIDQLIEVGAVQKDHTLTAEEVKILESLSEVEVVAAMAIGAKLGYPTAEHIASNSGINKGGAVCGIF